MASELNVGSLVTTDSIKVSGADPELVINNTGYTSFGIRGNANQLDIRNANTGAVFTTISSAGLATFSGNTVHGGAGGVQTFYASGFILGTAAIDIDVPCDDDTSKATIFKVEASYSHYPTGYTCILDTWTGSRETYVASFDVFALADAAAGSWSVSKTSNTNFRVSKSAGTYAGLGPYWVKVTHRNAS